MAKTPDPLEPEVLEFAIVQLSSAVTKLRSSRLKDSTIVLLLSHASGVPQKKVRAVLEAMESLGTTYLKSSRPPAPPAPLTPAERRRKGNR